MGAWGYKALESDEGLDVVDFLQDYTSARPEPEQLNLTLSELIDAMTKEGFFGKDFDDIDFYHDHSAMALAELYVMFQDTRTTGLWKYDNEYRNLKRIRSFKGDTDSFTFLSHYLKAIKDEADHEGDKREIVELWRTSDGWNEWIAHLNTLMDRFNLEISN
jgi:Domain of unknown function (DUF4259)